MGLGFREFCWVKGFQALLSRFHSGLYQGIRIRWCGGTIRLQGYCWDFLQGGAIRPF